MACRLDAELDGSGALGHRLGQGAHAEPRVEEGRVVPEPRGRDPERAAQHVVERRPRDEAIAPLCRDLAGVNAPQLLVVRDHEGAADRLAEVPHAEVFEGADLGRGRVEVRAHEVPDAGVGDVGGQPRDVGLERVGGHRPVGVDDALSLDLDEGPRPEQLEHERPHRRVAQVQQVARAIEAISGLGRGGGQPADACRALQDAVRHAHATQMADRQHLDRRADARLGLLLLRRDARDATASSACARQHQAGRAIKNGGFEVIVSGRSKGCGSSRETAPYSEREAGIQLVVAKSIEKIYGQNCQNIGLLTTTDFGLLDRIARRRDPDRRVHEGPRSDQRRRIVARRAVRLQPRRASPATVARRRSPRPRAR
jgi:hypothetical protein